MAREIAITIRVTDIRRDAAGRVKIEVAAVPTPSRAALDPFNCPDGEPHDDALERITAEGRPISGLMPGETADRCSRCSAVWVYTSVARPAVGGVAR